MEKAVAEADLLERVPRPRLALADRDLVLVEQAERDVVERAQRIHQEELLEREADQLGPQRCERAVAHRRDVATAHPHPTGRRPLERTHHVEKRGLARSRGTYDRDLLARVDLEIDRAERGHAAGIALINAV